MAPAMPESTIYPIAFESKDVSRLDLPSDTDRTTKKTAMTTARIVVASVESTSFRPTFPKIATSEANKAESRAYKTQFI